MNKKLLSVGLTNADIELFNILELDGEYQNKFNNYQILK